MKTPILVIVAALAVLALSSPAAAVERPLESWQVTAGETCTLVETNGLSVWPGNVLIINNGGTIIERAGVEDEAFVSDVIEFVAAGDTVSASVRFDEWSSLEVTLTCQAAPVTTTTQAPTTTVAESTTSTSEDVSPTTPTTAAPTTAAPTTAAPTTAAPTTAAPTTAAPTTTSGEEVAGPSTLPVTGSNAPLLFGLGGLLLAAGVALVGVKRHAA